MRSRRELLRAGCATGLAAVGTALAGCAGRRSSETRLGEIVVGNRRDRPVTVHLLVLCDGDVVLWRTDDLAARPDRTEDPPQGAVVDVPADRTDCRVHARLNDEETASVDLGEYDLACTNLEVLAEADGSFAIYYQVDAECG